MLADIINTTLDDVVIIYMYYIITPFVLIICVVLLVASLHFNIQQLIKRISCFRIIHKIPYRYDLPFVLCLLVLFGSLRPRAAAGPSDCHIYVKIYYIDKRIERGLSNCNKK